MPLLLSFIRSKFFSFVKMNAAEEIVLSCFLFK
jgi:hypothetical protein